MEMASFGLLLFASTCSFLLAIASAASVSAGPTGQISVVGCVSLKKSPATSSYVVNANHGSWPSSGFCRVVLPQQTSAGDPYSLTVEILNVRGWKGVNSGHPGVIYNAIDENNFDFVYFRPHQGSGCYQTGYVLNGNAVFSQSAACPNGRPSGGVWFTVRVEVNSNSNVNIYLDNALVTSLTAHFQTKGHGGVLVANGYQNVIHFRKFKISSLAVGCRTVQTNSGYTLVDANHGVWPADGFCRVEVPQATVISSTYELTVELLNVIGWKGVDSGHPGVIYNVIDAYNFDFVYFRPHQGSGCYQTGYVLNGNAVFSQSAACPNGRPSGGVWFTVRVVVNSNRNVKVFRDNVLVTSLTAHFQTKSRGGVLVANGYQNVIHFRKFKISPLAVGCRTVQTNSGYTLVDANHGVWPADGFCRVEVPQATVISGAYELTVELLNVIGWKGVDSGHPGVIYNVIDAYNFDFVYFRPHLGSGCYQTGYVLNGNAVFSQSAACPNGRPSGGVWFTVRVVVNSNRNVKVFKDNVLVTSQTAHFQTKGRGGVLVANGYQNVIHFRNYSVNTA